jgi:hypothetical protein
VGGFALCSGCLGGCAGGSLSVTCTIHVLHDRGHSQPWAPASAGAQVSRGHFLGGGSSIGIRLSRDRSTLALYQLLDIGNF